MKKFLLSVGAVLLLGAGQKNEVDISVYLDPKRPVNERVEALLSQMTLKEKIGQMEMVSLWNQKKIVESDFYDFGAWIAEIGPDEYNKLQAYSEKTRLKIPYLFGVDAAHGYAVVKNKTVYPTSISMAATFNRELVRKTAAMAAGDIRSAGNNWIFAPSIDIVQDARWGRTGETYGEDPYLSSELVKEAVVGYQNHSDSQKRVATSLKHLLGGGVSVGGVNHASAEISERAVRSFLLPPFKAGIEAGSMSIMPGHNDVAGIPAHSSKWLLTDVVKRELGFEGFYISDMGDVENLYRKHAVATGQKDAIKLAINAGLDMHMQSSDNSGLGSSERGKFVLPLEELVKERKVSIERIDDAVRRILTVKFKLGLFENRYVDPNKNRFITPESRELALEGARESIVLLKNEEKLLPLDTKKYKRILVTGPNANNQSILGDWSSFQPEENVTTILEGICQEAGEEVEIVYSHSGKIKGKVSKVTVDTTDPLTQQKILKEGGAISDYSIADAVKKARECDLAIIAVGGYGIRSDWGLRTYGESADRPSIDFYGRQEEFIKAVQATGIPVVVIIVNGKPLNNEWTTHHIPAIVDVWEPGMCGGEALGELLFGKENFSGKLPITVPQHAGQIPMYYYQKKTRYSTGYALGGTVADNKPAFCFGHGLSYTKFEYSDLKLDTVCKAGKDVTLTFKVKNVGRMAGKEIAMLFVKDEVSSVVTPISLLKGFEKVDLNPGEEKRISLSVPYTELGLWNEDMKYVVEPGKFTLKVGSSFDDIRLTGNVSVK